MTALPVWAYPLVFGATLAAALVLTPVALGIARRLNNYRFNLTFEEPIEPVGSATNEEDVRALLTQLFARLEYHIAKNPEQWVLLQPVWQT